MPREPQYLTTEEAGEYLGVTGHHVAYLCRQGELGRKLGRNWFVTKQELDSLERLPPGPRPKKKRRR